MDDERPDDELPGAMPTTVFVSDPSVEAERVAQLLRARGYLVADVPLSMLVARVAVQRPRVLLVDADGDGALEMLARMREIADADGIDIVFFGRENGAVGSVEAALALEGSGFFKRPVDVPTLLRKLEALTGGPSHGPMARPSTPPPSVASMSVEPLPPRRPGSLPPPSMRDVSQSPIPRASMQIPRIAPPPPGLLPSFPPEERRSPSAQVSTELEQLLADAERRIGGQVTHESVFPSPEEEIEAVLPADVLASLDEPIDDDENDEPEMGAHAKGTTSGGGGRFSTGGGTGAGTNVGGRVTNAKQPASDPPPQKTSGGGTHSGTTSGRYTDFAAGVRTDASSGGLVTTGASGGFDDARGSRSASSPPGTSFIPPTSMDPSASALPREAPVVLHAYNPPSGPTVTSGLGLGPSAPMPSVLAPGDTARTVAHSIVTRATGALCIESHEGVRRAVFREGDMVTAASGLDNESLLAFLVARGDLPPGDVQGLVGKLPPFGRHAGAALVAHGHLRQDQLWIVLREHAEWILGRMILQSTGTALMEPEPPGRLRGEPSVFERSTGAEVFVEVIRRVVAPEDALARVGGATARITDGPAVALESECALEPSIGERIQNARGMPVQALLDRSPEPDVAAVLYALDLLGVVEMVRVIGEPRPPSPVVPTGGDLDEDAVRARVRARLQLVEEGDYFALLGIPRTATSYEVRRAFVDLRRAFEPARLLTPQIADLNEDVRKIATVLDEAYEILRDNARRERYRRAIEGPMA